MKRRFLSLILVLSLMLTMCSAFAGDEDGIEPYASYYLDAYSIGLTSVGDGKMRATFGVYAADVMKKVGAYSLTLEEEGTTDKWFFVERVYGSSDPDLFYGTDTAQHVDSYTFSGLIPGVRYRVTLIAYAGDSTGSDTGTITSTPKRCTL